MTSYSDSINRLQGNAANIAKNRQSNNLDIRNMELDSIQKDYEKISHLSKSAGQLYVAHRENTIKAQTAELAVAYYRNKNYNPEGVEAIKETRKIGEHTTNEKNTEITKARRQGNLSPEFLNALKKADPVAVEKVARLALSDKLAKYESYITSQMLSSTQNVFIPGLEQPIQIKDIASTPGINKMDAKMRAADLLQRQWFEENGIAGFSTEWLFETGVYTKLEEADARLYKTWSAAADVEQSAEERAIAFRTMLDNPTPENLWSYITTTASGVDGKNKPIGFEGAFGEDYFEKAVTEGILARVEGFDLSIIDKFGSAKLKDVAPHLVQKGKPNETFAERWPTRFGKHGSLQRKIQNKINENADNARKKRVANHQIASGNLINTAREMYEGGATIDQIKAELSDGIKNVRTLGQRAGIENPTNDWDSWLESFSSGKQAEIQTGQALNTIRSNTGEFLDEKALGSQAKGDPEIANRLKQQKELTDSSAYKEDINNLEREFIDKLSIQTSEVSGKANYTDRQQTGWNDLKKNFHKRIFDYAAQNNGVLPSGAALEQIKQETFTYFYDNGGAQGSDDEGKRYYFNTAIDVDTKREIGFEVIEKEKLKAKAFVPQTFAAQEKANWNSIKATHDGSWDEVIAEKGMGLRVLDYNAELEAGKIPPDVVRLSGVIGLSVFDIMKLRQHDAFGELDDKWEPELDRASKLHLPGYLQRMLNRGLANGTLTNSTRRQVGRTFTQKLPGGANETALIMSPNGVFLQKVSKKVAPAVVDPWMKFTADRLGISVEQLTDDVADPELLGDFIKKDYMASPLAFLDNTRDGLSMLDQRFDKRVDGDNNIALEALKELIIDFKV